MEASRKKHSVILAYETSFSRTVAIRIQVRKPLTVWHFLIPFVFIFDLLRLTSETETFTKNFLFIKKTSLDAAFEINKGEDRLNKLAEIESEAREWLVSKKFVSQRILQGQIREVNLLIDHYLKLLSVEGDDYPSLVGSAYRTGERFAAFLQQLSSIEKEIDRAVSEVLGEREEVWKTMLTKQKVIDEIRADSVGKFFPEPKEVNNEGNPADGFRY